MKKSEAEPELRRLTHTWFQTIAPELRQHPDFSAFKTWLNSNGHGHLLQFRSVMGAHEDAERWFDEELKQTWRN